MTLTVFTKNLHPKLKKQVLQQNTDQQHNTSNLLKGVYNVIRTISLLLFSTDISFFKVLFQGIIQVEYL